MRLYSKFVAMIFITTYCGVFFIRIFGYTFIYQDPFEILAGSIPTVIVTFFLGIIFAILEHPILNNFEKVYSKARKNKAAITQSDIDVCWNSYKKFDIIIGIGDAIGFLLGAGSSSIISSIKGIVKFDPIIFIIVELQAIGIGFLCYTLNIFIIKRVLMTQAMREIGIKISDNLSSNLKIAVGTCVYISVINMITVPIGIIKNPVENGFNTFLVYSIIAALLNIFVCFITYTMIIKRIQSTEKNVSNTLLAETMHLADATKLSAENSQNQSAAVKEIVATMHDSTELANNIGEKIKEVTQLASKSRDAVYSGNEALQQNLRELLDIKNTNMLTIEGIKQLNSKINGIWDIVTIINNVADQTKIIAFNAELEASSSGEAGKNFHIVATEIRRLSDNIIDSIKEIREIISEIQKASDALILDSEKGTAQIDSGCQSARSLENGFQSILQSSTDTASSSKEILDNVNQLTTASEQIFITLQQIAQGIESFSQSTTNISAASESVKEIASLL